MFCIANDQQRLPENQYLDALKNNESLTIFLNESTRYLSYYLLDIYNARDMVTMTTARCAININTERVLRVNISFSICTVRVF